MPRSPRTRHLEEVPVKVCPECGLGAWTDPAYGRPRRFCSDACRQADYRRRLREREAEDHCGSEAERLTPGSMP